jgi:hypothetical protein
VAPKLLTTKQACQTVHVKSPAVTRAQNNMGKVMLMFTDSQSKACAPAGEETAVGGNVAVVDALGQVVLGVIKRIEGLVPQRQHAVHFVHHPTLVCLHPPKPRFMMCQQGSVQSGWLVFSRLNGMHIPSLTHTSDNRIVHQPRCQLHVAIPVPWQPAQRT